MKKVNEVMTRDIHIAAPDQTLAEAAAEMAKADIGCLPVGQRDKLVGMITDRDITIRCVAGNEAMSKVKAKDVMTSGVVYCRDNEDVEDAVRIMEGKQIRRLPVLDEAMQVVGMVSLGDVSHALPRDITGEVAKSVSAHHP